MSLEFDLPFGTQRRKIDHQEIERGHGHHARHHHRGKAAQPEQSADRHVGSGLLIACLAACRPDQQRDDHAGSGGGEADREQRARRRQCGRAPEPADDERPEPLADRRGNHVVTKRGLPAAPAARANRQHLVAGHAEHVAEPQQHAEAEQVHGRLRPGPEADAGHEHEDGANPRRAGVVAAVDPAPDLQRRENRDDGEAGGDDAEPEDGEPKLDRPVGRRDPDDEDQRLRQRDVHQEGKEQAIVEVAPGGDGCAWLLSHRQIGFSCPSRLPGGPVPRPVYRLACPAAKAAGANMRPVDQPKTDRIVNRTIIKASEPRTRMSPCCGQGLHDISAMRALSLLHEGHSDPVAAVNWSRPGQFFSSIVNSTPGRYSGITVWVGDHSLRHDWNVRALTPRLPWGGLRVRRFQRDDSDWSDRQGGVSFDRTVGRCDATSARPCRAAADSAETCSAAAPARVCACCLPARERLRSAPADDRKGVAPAGGRAEYRAEPGARARHARPQDRRRGVGGRNCRSGHHQQSRRQAGRDRLPTRKSGPQRDHRVSSGAACASRVARRGCCRRAR